MSTDADEADKEYLVTIVTSGGETSTTRHFSSDELDQQFGKVLADLGLTIRDGGLATLAGGADDIEQVTVKRVN
ncbi:hypothetical protein A9X05_21370 [Mycobacterium sp. E3298]|uniref:hypothetical protein n=1 Tax=unclassified Mycobacterium TaxID=2642494 RepID=UPI0007FBB7A8|nr:MULTISPECIES: hypothetical protein [unclassified Mycobacterium]OBG79042.1 hypothetical protein A5701_14930 [Mycobacterium sp. E3305]OBG79901.1 hypothetical protein A9X05_21370 [Mycobacterium sp. E3298]